MSSPAGPSVWAFILALLLSLIFMPVCVILGARHKMVIRPRLWRKSRSKRTVTYLGGPAVALAATAGALLSTSLLSDLGVILAGGVILAATGFLDNRRSRRLHPLARMTLQAAVAVWIWGLALSDQFPGPVGALATVAFLVAAANAFNLLDNMDGVAGATAAATGAGVTGLALFTANTPVAAPAAALCGACLGFLPHNWRRAKVYLGAGGPEFLGFVLAGMVLELTAGLGPGWRWVAAGTVLVVPALDSTVTLASRLFLGRRLFKGGIDHLSHRLVRVGLNTRRAALLHALAALIGAAGVGVAFASGPGLLPAVLGLFALLALALTVADERSLTIPSARRPVLRYAAAGLIGVSLLAMPPALGAARDLTRARAAFRSGIASAKEFDLAGAGSFFAAGTDLAASAQSKLEMPLTLPARLLPVLGDNLRAAAALASAGRLMGPAAGEALQAAGAFPAGPGGPRIGFAQGRIDTAPWSQAAERLSRASAGAELALVDVRRSGGLLLPSIAGARKDLIAQGGRAARTLQKASDAAALIPYLFGSDRSRTWFLAIQNPVELRATGGFLGAFGILSASSGKLSLERFDANTALPALSGPAPAPQEFADNYDRFSSRSFWSNTNMTPDFPTAAQVLTSMWQQATGRKVDGVIAIDAVGLNQLLKLVGPVNAPPVGQITSDTFLPLALNQAYIRFPQKESRSSFLLEVGREVWTRLLAGNFSDPRALLEPMGNMVSTKRLQMWSPDEQERIKRLGMGGELRPPQRGDYLMVVGQNAGGNKIDYYARRRIYYSVDLSNPRDIRGTLKVRIQNLAPSSGLPPYIIGPVDPADPAGLNRTFTSVYLPGSTGVLGALVDGKPGAVESRSELGLGVVSRFMEILAGSTSELTLKTKSRLASPGVYRLVVQQQPNLNPDYLRIDITVPPGSWIRATTPGMTVAGNRVSWSGKLESAKEFLVRYGGPGYQAGRVLAAN